MIIKLLQVSDELKKKGGDQVTKEQQPWAATLVVVVMGGRDEERLVGAHEAHETTPGDDGIEGVHHRGSFILIRTAGGQANKADVPFC